MGTAAVRCFTLSSGCQRGYKFGVIDRVCEIASHHNREFANVLSLVNRLLKYFCLLVVVALAAACVNSGDDPTAAPSEQPSPTIVAVVDTPTPDPTDTPAATPSDTPTPTPQKTATPRPTRTPRPTASATPTPKPTATPSPTPTPTSSPTATPTSS